MPDQNSHEFYETVARYYDAENAYMVDDLPFYSDLVARTGGPVLDVGAGTGRVTFHLAQESLRVVGVDISEAMLRRAERKLDVLPHVRDQVQMIAGDITDVELAESFALILVPYNGLMHFKTQAAQIDALKKMREVLRPDGLLALDLPNPGDLYGTPDDGSVVLERTFEEPDTGHLVMQQSVSVLDRAEQMMNITWIYDEVFANGAVHRTLAPLTLRYYFPAELDLLLQVAGWQRVERYGDYDGSPFVDESPRLLVLAQAVS